jgi:hypothetical protein
MSPLAEGWVSPDWSSMSGGDLKAHLLAVRDLAEGYVSGPLPFEEGHPIQLNDDGTIEMPEQAAEKHGHIVWRNYPVPGQPQAVPVNLHFDALIEKLKYLRNRARENVNIQVFPGGFLLEMVLVAEGPNGEAVRIQAGMIHFLNQKLELVRLHEYIDSVEMEALL